MQKEKIDASDLLELKVPLALTLKGVLIAASVFVTVLTTWVTFQTRMDNFENKIKELTSNQEEYTRKFYEFDAKIRELDKELAIHKAQSMNKN